MHRECENLSGGEMQMVAISRALLGAPGLVLLDEPSQGLAPKVVQDVMRTIERLKGEGVAVLLVEQNVATALAVADRCYVMDRGRIVHEGPARALADDARAALAPARDLTDERPCSRVEGLRKQYTRGLLRARGDLLARGGLHGGRSPRSSA